MAEREVTRPEDMSPDGTLKLFWQDDGDIIVTVRASGVRGLGASVEFCSSGCGSPRTLHALWDLYRAMKADSDSSPTHPGTGDGNSDG